MRNKSLSCPFSQHSGVKELSSSLSYPLETGTGKRVPVLPHTLFLKQCGTHNQSPEIYTFFLHSFIKFSEHFCANAKKKTRVRTIKCWVAFQNSISSFSVFTVSISEVRNLV